MPATCPDCGNALPATGFCPTCLLRGGLEMPELETAAFQAARATPNEEGLESRIMGRYKLGEKLGEGGFGVVYEAHQGGALRRDVAVKVLKSDVNTGQIIARFEAERQALALMDHPGIAKVLDAGETQDGRPFFVMERVHGPPVTEFVRQHELDLETRLRLFVEIAEAVHHAHQKGVIHRDIKPSNILITEENGRPRPKVIDFGIAKAVDAPLAKRTIYTQFDQVMGTPGYISPEQVERGAEAVDVRSDVYALGALLYEMLTDAPVVEPESMKGKSLHVALLEIARSDAPRPSLIKTELRGDLDAITLKAMAIEPERRYGSASALAEDVGRFLNHQPVTARAPGTLYLMRKFTQRHRWGVAAALGLVLMLCAATLVSWMNYRRAEKALELAAEHEKSERAGFSRQDYIAGRQAAERGRHGEAIAHLCRSLRTNPANEITAVYLHEMLQRTHIGRTKGGALRPPEPHTDLRFLGVNSRLRQIVAVCRPTGNDAAEQPDMLVRWEVEKGTRHATTLPTGVRVTAFQMSADEEIVVLGLSDGSLARFDFATARHTQFSMPMNGAVTALALTQDAKAVLAGTEKGAVQLWDLETHAPLAAEMHLGGPVHLLACDGKANLAVAASEADLACCAPRRAEVLGSPQRMPGKIGVLVMAAEHPWAAVGMRNGMAWIVDVPTLRLHGTPLLHSGPVTAASFSGDGRILLTGDDRGHVWTWQLPNARPLAATITLDGPVMLCRPLSQRGHALAVSQRGELRLWEALSRYYSTHRGKPARLAATAHDGTLTTLAYAETPEIIVWETSSRTLEPRFLSLGPPDVKTCSSPSFHASSAMPVSGIFSLDHGTKRIATNGDRRVRITKAGEDILLVPELIHEEAVTHLLLSPDARTLITITLEGVHHAWDTATGDALMPPWKHGEKARAVRMSADGRVYHYERPSGGWFTLPLPRRDVSAAEWFLDFAEKTGGRRLQADGTSPLIRRDFFPITGEDPSARLARWLLTPSHQRSLWPGDAESFATYLDGLIRSGSTEAVREARRFGAGPATDQAKTK